jgi:hypothetical protein
LNSSNSLSESTSISSNSNMLKGGLQLLLGSLNQFLLTKIKLPNFCDCTWHLLNFLSIITREKILYVSCFSHHWRSCLISLTSASYCLKIKSFIMTSSFVDSFVFIIISKIFKL